MKRMTTDRALAFALIFASCHVSLSFCWGADPNFYKYSVRHEKGAPPFFPMTKVESESVNSANGNLFFTIPLLSRAGRNGLGVNLALAYNSKIWDHYVSGGTLYATLAERDSWAGWA